MTIDTSRAHAAALLHGWLAAVRPPWRPGRLPPGPLALRDAGAFSLVVEAGARLRLLEGTGWVTFEGDAEDHVLGAGSAFVAPRHGRLAVQALAPLRFEVLPAAARLAA
jgi:hypothetical protein